MKSGQSQSLEQAHKSSAQASRETGPPKLLLNTLFPGKYPTEVRASVRELSEGLRNGF
jgi:hypothetical protein